MSLLDVSELSACYGKVAALHATNLSMSAGEMVAVLGPNGAGKSTLLRAIMGLLPTQGSVTFDGACLDRTPSHRRAKAGSSWCPKGAASSGR